MAFFAVRAYDFRTVTSSKGSMERVEILRAQALRLREFALLETNPARHQRFLSLATQSESLANAIEYELTKRPVRPATEKQLR